MAKPQIFHRNRPNPKGPGDGEEEEVGAETDRGRGGERGGGNKRETHNTPPPPTPRRSSRRREGQPAGDREEEEEQETDWTEEGEDEDRDTPRGAPVEFTCVGGDVTPPEENSDLPVFHSELAHLLLQGVYGDFPHHNDRSHLYGGIADDAAWQRCWHRLSAQSASWYATPSGAVRRRFTAILAAEWQGVIPRIWNSERPLVFAHVVLTKTLGVCWARDIQARITRRMELWERCQNAGWVGDAKAERAAREGRAAFSGE